MSENTPSTPENSFPFKFWFEQMNSDDQNVIEVDIFNSSDAIPLSTVFENIKDQEIARRIITRFKEYIEMKNNNVPDENLKVESKNIADYVEKITLGD